MAEFNGRWTVTNTPIGTECAGMRLCAGGYSARKRGRDGGGTCGELPSHAKTMQRWDYTQGGSWMQHCLRDQMGRRSEFFYFLFYFNRSMRNGFVGPGGAQRYLFCRTPSGS